ncbi:50S ribosomal protein L24 [Candidatus Gottesmanbacteria bacterium]|nr:50S ribosomal protein L24 [Candidatus Gottesmanbacteria bacterium]MBI3559938.1 50S ribosomal protein L24 [Candidatus Gottesmanbacteria bacterium]
MKLKKGDTVIVTTGKDKGRKGKVEHTFPGNGTVEVGGVNIYKRHTKKRDEKRPSAIIDITKPIHISKLALICPKCNQPTRVGYLVVKGEKERICRKCEQKI